MGRKSLVKSRPKKEVEEHFLDRFLNSAWRRFFDWVSENKLFRRSLLTLIGSSVASSPISQAITALTPPAKANEASVTSGTPAAQREFFQEENLCRMNQTLENAENSSKSESH